MSKQILIVDDEEDVRAIAKLGLEMGAGWVVLTASSGEEALQVATEQQPDAILLDMMMPNMDGRATAQALRQQPETCHIPVILLTAKVQQPDQDWAALQINAVFAKPFRPLKLAEQVREALGWVD